MVKLFWAIVIKVEPATIEEDSGGFVGDTKQWVRPMRKIQPLKKMALVYFSGPWENVLMLRQYLTFFCFRLQISLT